MFNCWLNFNEKHILAIPFSCFNLIKNKNDNTQKAKQINEKNNEKYKCQVDRAILSHITVFLINNLSLIISYFYINLHLNDLNWIGEFYQP